MFAWLVVSEDKVGLLGAATAKAWTGGDAVIAHLELAGRKEPRRVAIVWADRAKARRPALWPDVLDDWKDIYEEPLFPNDEITVLAAELSGLGAPAAAVFGGPGLVQGTVAWYEKGALISYEHVGSSSVSWDPDDGLGRPFDGTPASIAALGGRRVAKLFGSDKSLDVLTRIDNANRAIGEVLIGRVFYRFLDT
ncbi:MAG: hypothetical protein JWO36_4095, partial [Myxococcales bacterium]|nr:hypothetical protein [Myxococcales bacterium]